MSTATGYLQQASELCRKKEFSAAIPLLKQGVVENPKNEILLGMMASCYQELGMLEQAEEHYNKIVELNPDNFLAIHQLGMVAFTQSQWEQALIIWQRLLLRDDDFLTKYYASICCFKLGRFAEAKEFISLASQLTPQAHPVYPEVLKFKESFLG